jgi:hypothetical protein
VPESAVVYNPSVRIAAAEAREALLVSTSVVALAEMGDKTQLLSFVLASRLTRKISIILGILCATLANHFPAGCVGGLAREPGRAHNPALGDRTVVHRVQFSVAASVVEVGRAAPGRHVRHRASRAT